MYIVSRQFLIRGGLAAFFLIRKFDKADGQVMSPDLHLLDFKLFLSYINYQKKTNGSEIHSQLYRLYSQLESFTIPYKVFQLRADLVTIQYISQNYCHCDWLIASFFFVRLRIYLNCCFTVNNAGRGRQVKSNKNRMRRLGNM